MAWLNYDEHVDSLSTMDNEVGVTSPESTTQTLPLFEEYTPHVTYPEEVEKTLGTPIEVKPLNETKLEEVGLNCNHNTPFSSREVLNFDGQEPQPLLNSPSLDEMFDDDWGLESKEVSSLREELSLFDRPNKVERWNSRSTPFRVYSSITNFSTHDTFSSRWFVPLLSPALELSCRGTLPVIFDEKKLGSS
ncbi:hypothetical protein Tco_0295928 [Tanacetum coccineum]